MSLASDSSATFVVELPTGPTDPSAGFLQQLPDGVLWASEIPRCLSWLTVTDDALALLTAKNGRHSKLLHQRLQPPTST